MFKKMGVLSVAVALIIVLGLCTTPCSAQSNVANVSKKGSLLIFPKILTIKGIDTIITIGNDYPAAVSVKCYWMDSDQKSWDFVFPLTANQPVWFRASDGTGSIDVAGFGEGKQGELKCWAIKVLPDPGNPGGTIENQIAWNDLYGTAVIVAYTLPSSSEYNAFAFAARNVARGSPVITPPDTVPGTLLLNGSFVDIGYDACPAYLIFNFFAEENRNLTGGLGQGAGFSVGESDLALVPCKQDFRQDSGPICTKVKFDIWNENESKLTGSYQCVKCWFEGVLSDIGTDIWSGCDLADLTNGKCKPTGFGGNKFTSSFLKTDLGRFRVTPDSFAACAGVFSKIGQDGKTPVDVCGDPFNQWKTPFLGLLITELLFVDGGVDSRLVTTTPAYAGAWVAGPPSQPIPGILWDPGVGDSPAAKR
jgi:hypothetical protein